MNRVVWRVAKLLFALIVAGICLTQLSVIKLNLSPPYPTSNGKRVEVKFGDDVFHHHNEKQEKKNNALTPVKRRFAASTPAFLSQVTSSVADKTSFKFDDILLRKPQQSQNFHHKGGRILWPTESASDDRILTQMMYSSTSGSSNDLKTILAYNGLRDGMREGQESFRRLQCPVDSCYLTSERGKASTADLILWQEHLSKPAVARPNGQIWMVFMLESPYHTTSLTTWKNQINWTATYRSDSTLVAPYERFTYFNSSVTQLPLKKNYADGKTKKVAWFVSNCGARNNRLGYAKELAKHIEVDIYGACGTKSCPRNTGSNCNDMLSKTYKFYLAFENSNCKDYITEKFFVNGLKNDVVPIVMGAHPDDYKRAAPYNSYIHVDDFESPEHLAKYLYELDRDDDKYNDYFRWKGTGDNINTYFWCRLCALTHAVSSTNYTHLYDDIENWWRGPQVCQDITNKMWPKWQ